MKFGRQFNLKKHPLWKDHYLDYDALKELINNLVKEKKSLEKQQEKVTRKDIKGESEFFTKLEKELEKVDKFYIKLESECAKQYDELVQKFKELKKDESVIKLEEDLMAFANMIMDCKEFSYNNTKAFIKILKKHDKKLGVEKSNEFLDKVYNSKFYTSQFLEELELKVKKMLSERKGKPTKHTTTWIQTVVSKPPTPITFDEFDLSKMETGKVIFGWVPLSEDSLGQPISVPVMIARGKKPGPILGITSTIHGDELNGIPLLHRLFAEELDVNVLNGTVCAVVVTNPPGYKLQQRQFNDGQDLNRIMPGDSKGTAADQYAHALLNKIIKQFNYLIDLHTASRGRMNSLYVRVDATDGVCMNMATLQNAQIILHNTSNDKTLRAAASKMGIKSITVEIGNPNVFQKRFIKHALLGVSNIMSYLMMLPTEIELPQSPPTLVTSSYWLYTDVGGVLFVLPECNTWVRKGEKIAYVTDMFGILKKNYYAPEDAIVIGASSSPVNQSGDRIVHLGVIGRNWGDKP